MGLHRVILAITGASVAALALTGCGAPPPAPPSATADEIAAIRQEQAQSWWDSMATGTTMPQVEVIAELPMEKASVQQSRCLEEADLPGVTVLGPGEFSFDSGAGDPAGDEVMVQWWICAQQYPIENEDWWILSSAQLEWLYDYFDQRYLPCLRSLGVEPVGFPSREAFLGTSGGYPAWLPFDGTVVPNPSGPHEWARIAQRCPLPEILLEYGLPGYPD